MRSMRRAKTNFATLAALALLGISPCLAQTAPACLALHDKCLLRVHRQGAVTATGAVDKPHMTETECYDSYHAAQRTGVWPEHLPFNFAIECSN